MAWLYGLWTTAITLMCALGVYCSTFDAWLAIHPLYEAKPWALLGIVVAGISMSVPVILIGLWMRNLHKGRSYPKAIWLVMASIVMLGVLGAQEHFMRHWLHN